MFSPVFFLFFLKKFWQHYSKCWSTVSTWHLSSLTRDGVHASCIGSVVLTREPPGTSLFPFPFSSWRCCGNHSSLLLLFSWPFYLPASVFDLAYTVYTSHKCELHAGVALGSETAVMAEVSWSAWMMAEVSWSAWRWAVRAHPPVSERSLRFGAVRAHSRAHH